MERVIEGRVRRIVKIDVERVIEARVRKIIKIDDMQFGFMPERGTMDAIFIVRQLQEKFLGKNKDLWMAFVDLEKALTGCQGRWSGGHSGLWGWMSG